MGTKCGTKSFCGFTELHAVKAFCFSSDESCPTRSTLQLIPPKKGKGCVDRQLYFFLLSHGESVSRGAAFQQLHVVSSWLRKWNARTDAKTDLLDADMVEWIVGPYYYEMSCASALLRLLQTYTAEKPHLFFEDCQSVFVQCA